MHCKDCKHWGHPMQKYRDPNGNECLKVVWMGGRPYDNTPLKNGIILEAYATDDTGLDAKVSTGPLFGCVNFEKVDEIPN